MMHEIEVQASFWDHLEELRRTMIAVLVIIAASVALSLVYYQPLLKILGAPLQYIENSSLHIEEQVLQRVQNHGDSAINFPLPQTAPSEARYVTIPPGGEIELKSSFNNNPLVLLGPLEGIKTTLRICFWTGLVASSPLWLLLLLRFIAPALREQGQRLILPFIAFSMIFLSLGFLFAYFVTLPLANNYLYQFNVEIGRNFWTFAHYFDYTILMLLANGLAAELSLILFYLVHFKVFSAEALAAKRRHAIVAAFVLGAVLTPPDILTQFMLAIPLIIFYELAVVYARFRT